MPFGYAASGFAVGLLVGLTGIGGGSLMTPLLILLFGIHPTTAVGTDLLFASATKAAGAIIHGTQRTVLWPVVGRLLLGSLPAAGLTLIILDHVGVHGTVANRTVSHLLALLLLITALALLARPWLLRSVSRWQGGQRPEPEPAATLPATIAIGLVLGVVVTICSVGAGALGTVALLLLYPRFGIAKIVGSDIAHAVPLTLIAGLGHWWLGSVNLGVLVPLLAGSVPGIVLGSLGVRFAPEPLLRIGLAVLLAITGLRLLQG
ncbi:MAG: sulfite exporter TauE/SafE family protein [Acetobacteraceae bacterium]